MPRYCRHSSGDADPALERISEPETSGEFGVWLLIHPDMRRNARIRAFSQEIRAMIAGRTAQLLGAKA